LFVIRKFNLIFCRLLVVNIAGIAASETGNVSQEDEMAASWDVENLA